MLGRTSSAVAEAHQHCDLSAARRQHLGLWKTDVLELNAVEDHEWAVAELD
jgi:hypothetical protein